MEEHARELAGMPPEWKMCGWEVQPRNAPPDKWTFVNVRGAVCTVLYTKGPKKGRLNWDSADWATECTVSIKLKDHDLWKRNWEVQHDACQECQGDGQEIAGWNVKEGLRYRPCTRCATTGKPPLLI